MKISKNKNLAFVALFTILVVYFVIAFVVPFTHSAGFWIGFIFGLVSILLTAGVCAYAMGRGKTMKSKFYGWSLINVGWVYLVLQIICSFVFMGISFIPAWVSALLSVILLASCIIGLIATDTGIVEIERLDKKVPQKVFFIKSFQIDLETLVPKADNALVKKELLELIETVKYSDPMSHESLEPLELKIVKGDIIGVPSYQGYLGLWVDGKKLKEAGMTSIDTEADFIKFAKATTKNGQYGYGGSWEKTYVFNEIATFVNLFGGDYYDWTNPGSRNAVKFMWDMANTWKVTPVDQIADKYEQMDQKINDGKYAMVFMWGTGDDYKNANRYGKDQIHEVNMPKFVKRSIFTDSWSYVLNAASKHKDAAYKFLQYTASQDGELKGWTDFNRYPARSDVSGLSAVSGDVKDIYSVIQSSCEIHGRPMVPQTMEFITAMGTLFQNYIQNSITLDQFCTQAQQAVQQYKK